MNNTKFIQMSSLNEAFERKYFANINEAVSEDIPVEPVDIKRVLSIKDSNGEAGEDFDNVSVIFTIKDKDAAYRLEAAISDYMNEKESREGEDMYSPDDWEEWSPKPEIFANAGACVDWDHGESATYSGMNIDKIDWNDDCIEDEKVIYNLLSKAWGQPEYRIYNDIDNLIAAEKRRLEREAAWENEW